VLSSFSVQNKKDKLAYLQVDSAGVVILPESMDHMNLDKITNIRIERVHQEVQIVKVIELPTF
tara:strand:- start:368 stop:556 length:189 start_codon:yes stop_codon:yes gene_type:complete